MLLFSLRTLLFLIVVNGLLFHVCNAAQLTLNINVNIEDRQFLTANQQKIAIAIANPLSENNTSIIVPFVIEPIANLTQIAFESDDIALYLSYWPVAVFDIIKMVLQTKVIYGGAYSFDGRQINGEGTGLDGYVTIYFNAPLHSTQPVVTGLAWYIYDMAIGKPTMPVPINYYTLHRFETRIIPKSNLIVWVFIVSDITAGSILPISILKPVSNTTQSLNRAAASVATLPPALQIGRYLPVDLDASEQTTIHFEREANAFVYGSY